MKTSDSVFNKPENQALIKRWNIILEELGYENVDIAGNISNMANSGKFVYIHDYNFMTLIANKYQYIMDSAGAYYGTIEAIYNRQSFEEKWHKNVFYLRLQGKSTWEIGKALDKGHATIIAVLDKYIQPKLKNVNAKATIKWVLNEQRWNDRTDKMILEGFLADRPIEKSAKDCNIHVDSAVKRLMSYILEPEQLSDRAILRRYWIGKTIPMYVKAYIDGMTQQELADLTGLGKSTINRKIISMVEEAKQS